MRKDERLTQILQVVADHGDVSIASLVDTLGASPATIRRDLEELAGQHLVLRTRGGARLADVAYELPFKYKTARQADEKQRIAAHAASLVRCGEVVGINGGTTTSLVAEHLSTRDDLQGLPEGERPVVVTNALNIANQLSVRPQVRTVVCGGTARALSYELIGPLAVQTLEQLTLDTAILGANAVHPEYGAMAHHEGEAEISRLMARLARRVIVVADSSKLGRSALARFVDPQYITVLITTSGPGSEAADEYAEAGTEVHRV